MNMRFLQILGAASLSMAGCAQRQPQPPVCLYGPPADVEQMTGPQVVLPAFDHFEIMYRGTQRYPIYHYYLEYRDGVLMAGNGSGMLEEDPEWVVAPAGLLEKILQIIEDEGVLKYKDSYLPRFEVRDGYSWYITFELDGKTFYSSGSNAYPKGQGRQLLAHEFNLLFQTEKDE